MPRKKVTTTIANEPLYSVSFDRKIINLAVLFFGLSTILFILGIFKLNKLSSTMPFSGTRDYVVFEKNSNSGNETLKVYRSGKVISLGSKMAVDVLSPQKLDSFLATIDNTDILNKQCPENPTSSENYTIKLGVQVKRSASDGCKTELQQIESQIFQ